MQVTVLSSNMQTNFKKNQLLSWRTNIVKTVLITGATDGIGKHLAKKLSSEGHHVILHFHYFTSFHCIIRTIKRLQTIVFNQ